MKIYYYQEAQKKLSSINLSSCIKEKALGIGYDLCGITPVDLVEEYSSRLDERIRNFPESRTSYEMLYPLAFPQKKCRMGQINYCLC